MAVAIKQIYSRSLQTVREITASVYLDNHDNLIDIIDVFYDELDTYIVMPYLEKAQELMELAHTRNKDKNKEKLSQDLARTYMRQILSGVAHLQDPGLFHGDLHGANVMVQSHLQKATILDFGRANFGAFGKIKDVQSCGAILQMLGKAAGRMGAQVQRLIDALKSGKITAAQALNHAWFQEDPKICLLYTSPSPRDA